MTPTTSAEHTAACASQPRIVIVLNEKIEAGRIINAASHLALGFGASASQETRAALNLQDYKDRDGRSHANISALGLVVLKANGSQLRTLKARADEAGIATWDFLETMTGGTYIEQIERTRLLPSEALEYLGVLLFGTRNQLDPLTKKFSLFK
jgi:hypothetical protein